MMRKAFFGDTYLLPCVARREERRAGLGRPDFSKAARSSLEPLPFPNRIALSTTSASLSNALLDF